MSSQRLGVLAMVVALVVPLAPIQVLAQEMEQQASISVDAAPSVDAAIIVSGEGDDAPTIGDLREPSQPRRGAFLQNLQSAKQGSDALNDAASYVPSEVLVRFKDHRIDLRTPRGLEQARAFSSAQHLDLRETIRSARMAVLQTRGSESVAASVARLERNPDVLWAQPNYRYQKTTNDARFAELWALENTGQLVESVAGTEDADIDAPEAWAISDGRNDVIVAVIDDGVAYNHPDLAANMWDGSNFVNIDGVFVGTSNHGFDIEDFDGDPLPTSGSHGTHIAGTIAATQGNSVGIAGVAPRARIMALKFNFTTEQAVRAMNFAEANGAQIIVASWGGPNEDLLLKERIEAFPGLFVTAAGNDGVDHATNPRYPCDFDLANIVCVAATDQGDERATFSDYGVEPVDIGAPGVNILSTVPVIATPLNENFDSPATPEVPATLSPVGGSNWGTYDFADGIYNVVLYGDANNLPYAGGAESLTTTALMDLSGASSATLAFSTQCDTEPGDIALNFDLDGMWAYYSTDGSTNFELARWNESTTDDDTDPDNGPPIVMIESALPAEALTTTTAIRFVWRTNENDDTGTDGDGCWIDNVKLTTFDDGAGDAYEFNEGTSMAAPHVAGVAALVRGYNQNVTTAQVKSIIMETGDALASLAGQTVSGKRVNAANALAIFAPHVGFSEDDVIPASELNTQGILGDGQAAVKIPFRVRDDVAGLPVTLKQFEYSTDGGETWQAPANGDASGAIGASRSPGVDWRDNEYTTALDYSDDPDTAFGLIWYIRHEDLTGLAGVDQNDVRIRFKANDGAIDSPFAESEAFSVDLLAPTAVLPAASGGGGGGSGPNVVTEKTNMTFSVFGDDAVSYQYSLDGDAFSFVTPIVEPIVIAGLTDGVHTVRIITIDDVGNVQTEADATTFTWTVDTTAGTAIFISTPPTLTTINQATFVVGGTDVAAFKFRIDGGDWSDEVAIDSYAMINAEPEEVLSGNCETEDGPCVYDDPTPGAIYIGHLAEGPHTIKVIGGDALNNWQAEAEAASFNWVTDYTAPLSVLSNLPGDPTNSTAIAITVGGDDVVAYTYDIDGKDGFILNGEVSVDELIVHYDLAEGTHVLHMTARDAAGNWQPDGETTYTWTIDLTAPTLTEVIPAATPTNDTTPDIVVTVENGAAWEVLRGEIVLASGIGTGEAQVVELAQLTDGIYTLTLAATDAAGNRATLTLEAFVVDTASPAGISLRDVPASPTNATGATITVVAGDDVVAYRSALDGGAFGDEVSVAQTIVLNDLADGTHTLRVIGRDAAGNWMPESIAVTATWSVDTVAPTVELSNLPFAATPATVAKITVGGEDVIAYQFALDGDDLANETLVEDPITLTGLSNAVHTIAVIGKDAAGNWQADGNATTFTWRVDRSLAVPPTAEPGSGTLAAPQRVRFSAPLADDIHYAYADPDTLSCATGSSMGTTGELFVDREATIYVVACYAGGTPSEVQSFSYTFARGGGGGGGGGGSGETIFSAPAPSSVIVVPTASVPTASAAPTGVTGQVLGIRAFVDGILVRVNERDIYLVDGTVLHRVPNPRALWRYRNRERVEVRSEDIAGYTIGESVLAMRQQTLRVLGARAFASGVLLRVNGGTIYVLEGATARKIPTLEQLWKYRDRERLDVSEDALLPYKLGTPIS